MKQPGKGKLVRKNTPPPYYFKKPHPSPYKPGHAAPNYPYSDTAGSGYYLGSKQALQRYKTCPARVLLVLEAPRPLKDEAFPPGRARRRPVHGKCFLPDLLLLQRCNFQHPVSRHHQMLGEREVLSDKLYHLRIWQQPEPANHQEMFCILPNN